MEFTTLSNAVSAYQQKHQNDLDFQKLGAGSFGSWKVTVLLHNQKDNTWKFEDANIFQRVFWKIAKYIPFLKPTYEKVNLDKIHAALKNETDPKATILMGRIEQLWQMKMKGVQPKEALETIKQQAASLKTSVKDQQVSASEDKKAAASKFEDTDKTEGMEIEKNPPVGQLPKDYEWAVPQKAKVGILKNDLYKITLDDKFVILETGNATGHAEYEAVKKRLALKDQVDQKLCTISPGGATPEVMLKTDSGKIRIYQFPKSYEQNYLVYQEFNTIEEAIKDYKRQPAVSSLCWIRARVAVMDKTEMFFDAIKNAVQELQSRQGNSPEMVQFLKDVMDPAKPLNKEADLKTIDELIKKELKNGEIVETPLVNS